LNVEGTHEILRLAADGVPKAVHFVSTMGVHGRGTTHAREHDSLEEPPEGLQHGYSESKWVAEALLRKASERGIAVCIYRPGIIVGDSRTGACAPNDLFNSWIRACIEVGTAPDLENPFDMTPVDYVAQALVRLSMDRTYHGTSYHLVNPSPISARELVELVDASGYSIQLEPYDRWYARILRAGGREDFPLRKHLKLLPSSGRHLFLHPPRFDSEQALAHLRGSGVEFPSIDTRFMEMTLRYLRQLGLIRRAAQ
jgi:thioester reductase-like protein